MNEEELEYYEEIDTEGDYEDDASLGFYVGLGISGCIVLAFIAFIIKKTFKNVHLKIGNKIEVGIETKE